MSLNPTYYKNPTRTITGLNNVVFDNDVLLLCDTSLGVVEITLNKIPSDRFSLQYKLFIIDKSNNASVNNITIKAPTGFTVNNSTNAIINQNGGTVIITISSNSTYNAQFNYIVGGGGGNAIIVENEGTEITPNLSKLNFVGNLVNATAVGDSVTIDIQSIPAIAITNAQLLNLISNNNLIPNQTYQITDAIFIQTPLPAPFIRTASVYLKSISNNKIENFGGGLFFNADYNNIGNYSGVTGFVQQRGIWQSTLNYVVGDVVIWNNVHWLNLTGNNDEPSDISGNWQFLAQIESNGYIGVVDFVQYNIQNNSITSRKDDFENYVENNILTYPFQEEAFAVFQWGNGNNVSYNSVLTESCFFICNNLNVIAGNTIDLNSFVQFDKNFPSNTGVIALNIFKSSNNTFIGQNGTFFNNVIYDCENSSFSTQDNTTQISSNFLKGLGVNDTIDLINGSQFLRNRVEAKESQLFSLNLNGTRFNDNIIEKYTKIQITSSAGNIENNNFILASIVEINSNFGTIQKNSVSNSELKITGSNQNNFSQNIIQNSFITITDISAINGNMYDNFITNATSLIIGTCGSQFARNIFYGANIEIGNTNDDFNDNEIKSSVINIDTIFQGGKFVYNKFNDLSSLVNPLIPSQRINIFDEFAYNDISNRAIITIKVISLGGKFRQNVINSSILILDDLVGRFEFNNITQQSQIGIGNIDSTVFASSFSHNNIFESVINIGRIENGGNFNENIISMQSNIQINNALECNFEQNNFEQASILLGNGTEAFNNGAEIRSNSLKASSLTVQSKINHIYNLNDIKNSTITYNNASVPFTNGIKNNVIYSSFLSFFNFKIGIENNNFTNVFYNIDNGNNDIEGNVLNNSWSDVNFQTQGIQVGSITNTIINKGSLNVNSLLFGFSGILAKGISTLQYNLDLNNPLIYDSATNTLTIPATMEMFFGEFILQNANGQIIDFVVNLSTLFPTTFKLDNSASGTVNFRSNTNQLLSPTNGILTNTKLYSNVINFPYPIDYNLGYNLVSDEIQLINFNGRILIKNYLSYP